MTDLWLIGGFLGSGKTTVLNHLLGCLSAGESAGEDGRVGVIVNDFGRLGVDASLVRTDGDLQITELTGGQIFCACLSGSFVNAIGALVERGVTTLLVEASGLAKPAAMRTILQKATSDSDDRLQYRGMLCVVDAARWKKLRSLVNAVEEQVVTADLVVINKTDLVDPDTVADVRAEVAELNQWCQVLETRQGVVPCDALPVAPTRRAIPGLSRFAGWDGAGRPNTAVYLPPELPDGPRLRTFVERLASRALRIKGYVAGPDTDWWVSASGEQVELGPAPEGVSGRQYGLSVICSGDANAMQLAQDAWDASQAAAGPEDQTT